VTQTAFPARSVSGAYSYASGTRRRSSSSSPWHWRASASGGSTAAVCP